MIEMPKKIGDEVLPTIDELEEVPKAGADDELIDAVFKDGDEVYDGE